MENATAKSSSLGLIFFLIILTGVLGLAAILVWPYLIALLVGAILAVLVNPIFEVSLKKIKIPWLVAAIVTIGIMLVVVIPIFLFSAIAIKQGALLGKEISEQGLLSSETIASRISDLPLLGPHIKDLDSFETLVRMEINKLGPILTQSAVKFVANVPGFFLQIAISLIGCFFFLCDGKGLMNWIGPKIPLDTDVKTKLKQAFLDTSLGVIWATVAAAAAQAILVSLGFIILGVPNVILALGATFILAWIPLIGSTPVWISATFYLFSKNYLASAITMVAIGLLVGIIDNIVRSFVLKGRGNMHPLISIIAVIGGVSLFGASGIFTGPIVIALIIAILDVWPLVAKRTGIRLSQ